MDPDLILAIDQGTTGTTCLLVDRNLTVHGRANREFPQHFPRPGEVEHDPDELWTSVIEAIAAALADANLGDEAGKRIAAIGITNQRETSLIWDRETGEPIHRALVWQDRRTAQRCEQLRKAGHVDEIRSRTGLVIDPYFSGTKLAWALDNVADARSKAEAGSLAAGTIDTYLIWRLTGGTVHATEPSNASRTMLWGLTAKAGDGTRGWDGELCSLIGVPHCMLPEVRPCTAHFGVTNGVPGLPDGIAIHGVAGDQQSALFGQACFTAGEAKCTYGTGAFVMLNTGSDIVYSEHGLLTTVGWQLGDETTYCLEGSAFMAGAMVQWLRDNLGFIETSAEITQLAGSVESSQGVVVVPGHTGLGAPYWRPEARGLIRGLTRGTNRAHIARATLEGIALEVADLLEAMTQDLGKPLASLRVDGGAAANDLLMQIQCDLLNLDLERPTLLETTAMGAVFLAGLGVGMWSGIEDVRAAWARERAFTPAADRSYVDTLRAGWAVAIEQA